MSILYTAESSIDIVAPACIVLHSLLRGLRLSVEADHLAAVSTMVASGRKKLHQASILGASLLGFHTATLIVVGIIVLLLLYRYLKM